MVRVDQQRTRGRDLESHMDLAFLFAEYFSHSHNHGYVEILSSGGEGIVGSSRELTGVADLPSDLATKECVLFESQIGNGMTMRLAINEMLKRGVPEDRIIIIGFVATVQAIEDIKESFPEVEQIIGGVDEGIDARGFVVPGIGNFSKRYTEGKKQYSLTRRAAERS